MESEKAERCDPPEVLSLVQQLWWLRDIACYFPRAVTGWMVSLSEVVKFLNVPSLSSLCSFILSRHKGEVVKSSSLPRNWSSMRPMFMHSGVCFWFALISVPGTCLLWVILVGGRYWLWLGTDIPPRTASWVHFPGTLKLEQAVQRGKPVRLCWWLWQQDSCCSWDLVGFLEPPECCLLWIKWEWVFAILLVFSKLINVESIPCYQESWLTRRPPCVSPAWPFVSNSLALLLACPCQCPGWRAKQNPEVPISISQGRFTGEKELIVLLTGPCSHFCKGSYCCNLPAWGTHHGPPRVCVYAIVSIHEYGWIALPKFYKVIRWPQWS